MDNEIPEADATPDTAWELGRQAGYDEAMRELFKYSDANIREALRDKGMDI